MRILIEPDRCTGHGRCYSLVSTLFDSDEEGHAIVLVDQLTAEQVPLAESAVMNCPEQAISIDP
jgi:ferredoxin